MKKLVQGFVILSIGTLFVGVLTVYMFIWSPIDGNDDSEIIIDVKPGMSLRSVIRDLEAKELIRSGEVFYYFLRVYFKGATVKSGEYAAKKSMAPVEIWKILASGHGKEYIFSIHEGLNSFQISQIFERGGFGSSEEFLKLVFDKSLAVKLTQVEANSLEGYLFPDTYKINKYIGAKELITVMVRRALNVIDEVRRENPTKMTIHNMVTIASIVEKETGAPNERPRISSVIQNRLAKGMKLQMDPTVIYGYWRKNGKYIENIKRQDLLEPNEFNTYTFYGLPSGPISNPGRESLIAALRPEKSPYLFFVSRNDGTHVFTETLAAHNKAVSSFQVNQKSREGKSWRDLSKNGKVKSKKKSAKSK